MFNPFRIEQPKCPVCGRRFFPVGGHGPLRCALCNAEVYIPAAYGRWMWLLIAVVLTVVGPATFRPEHAGTWLLLIIFSSIPLRIALGKLIPPWLKGVKEPSRFPFLIWYVSIALTMPLSVSAMGWFHVLTGGSQEEIREFLVAISLPLAWFNSSFLLNSNNTFFDACGVVLGNSFFYAVGMFGVWRGARAVIHRNRVTVMNIEGQPDPREDEL